MTTTRPTVHEIIDMTAIKRLAQTRGVCLTLFLSDQRPGAPTGSHHSVLRQLAREACSNAGWSTEVLESLNLLAEDDKLREGGPGFAVFCSTDGIECYRAPGLKAEFIVASHFHLTPLLQMALAPRDFCILGIGRKRMRLCRYQDGVVTEIAWPDGVVNSLDEAEGGREAATGNHASTGASPSAKSSVQFDSPNRPDREGAGHHLAHFFRMVDAGLTPVLAAAPLL